MTRTELYYLTGTAVALALTLGPIGNRLRVPDEAPLAKSDILIVENDGKSADRGKAEARGNVVDSGVLAKNWARYEVSS
jgi:hypothetical protein